MELLAEIEDMDEYLPKYCYVCHSWLDRCACALSRYIEQEFSNFCEICRGECDQNH